jgi:CHAT domain-containing protein
MSSDDKSKRLFRLKLFAKLTSDLERRRLELIEGSKGLEELNRGGIITVVGESALLGRLAERCERASRLLQQVAESKGDGEASETLTALDRELHDPEWDLLKQIKEAIGGKIRQQADMIHPMLEGLVKWRSLIEKAKEAVSRGLKAHAPVVTEEREIGRLGEILRTSDRAYREGNFRLFMETIELLPSEKDAEGLLERIRKKTDETQEFARQADLLMLRAPLDLDRRYNYTMLLRTASEPGSHGINIQGPKTVVEGDRAGISNIIQRVTKAIYSGPEGDSPLRKSPPPPVEPIQSLNLTALLQRMGEFVYRVYLPNFMKDYLRDTTCSVMITTNDLELPWELMYCHGDFLCLQRPVSRMPMGQAVPRHRKWDFDEIGGRKLRFLLIYSDPKESLPEARVEILTLQRSLTEQWQDRIDVVMLDQNEATGERLNNELQDGKYDVIHYAGHAHFNSVKPEHSCLLVNDGKGNEEQFDAEKIEGLLTGRPLVFLNACESGFVQNERQPTHAGYVLKPAEGLASAFLYGGSLACVGSLWPIYDVSAAAFALEFYRRVLEGYMLGEAMRIARVESKKEFPKHVTWASFALYGDATFRLAY